MAAQIVVTGFEPWAHGVENPTLEVLDQLRASNDIEGELTTVRLPVESDKLADITSKTLDELRPDLWISLGLAAGLAVIAVERIAANVMDFPIPDNVGIQHGGNPVFEGGPAAAYGDAAGQDDRHGAAQERACPPRSRTRPRPICATR